MKKRPFPFLFCLLLAVAALALFAGRFPFSPLAFFTALGDWLAGRELTAPQNQMIMVMLNVRLPRVLAALIIGAALSVSGAAYQALFLNPLVSPGILGVLAGASFGAGLGIVFMSSWASIQALAFIFACLAVLMSLGFASFMRKSSLLVLVLGGMITSAFFTSLTTMLKFIADPNRQLPELTYWLMGTFSRLDGYNLFLLGLPMLAGIVFLSLHGKIINALSMGEEEARALGVPVKNMRLRIIAAATLISALTVSLAGIVGWVGLVIPHILRFSLGPDNRVLLPAAALAGAVYLTVMDMLARNLFTAELPIGVFTSLISLPIFALSLRYSGRIWK
jgi:iron complex transport system permease protein